MSATAQRSRKVVLGGAAAGKSAPERDGKVPGREASAATAADVFPAGDRRTARLLVGITAGTALAFACIAFVGFQLILHTIGIGKPPEVECTEGVLPDACGDGRFCQAGRCMVNIDLGPSRCDVGDPCGATSSCVCDGAMECVADACAMKLPPQPDVCETPEVLDALRQLNTACAGDIRSCPAPDLGRFAIKYKNFDKLVANFPGTLTVHFPGGLPPISTTSTPAEPWPKGAIEATYRERLARSADAFRAAKFIFVIARSSPGGNVVRNELFAQERGKVVKQLILDALALPNKERDEIEGKFRDFILGPKRKLDRAFFAERFANRFITWDQGSRERLLHHLPAEELSEADETWVQQTINQVVVIVPVACEVK